MNVYPETNEQFLARILLATRENDSVSQEDSQRLSDLAQFGRQAPTTMPEERRKGDKPLAPEDVRNLVSG